MNRPLRAYHRGMDPESPREVLFASSRDLLSRYVAEGPGQLVAPLPGPPAPGSMPVGQIVSMILAFRDRALRIPVRCRVLAVKSDGDGHWRAHLEFASPREARAAFGGAPAPLRPRLRVTLPSGAQAEAAIGRMTPDVLELEAPIAATDGDVVRLSIRAPGRLLPLRLAGEVRTRGGRWAIDLLFREPREELAWSQLVEREAERRGELFPVQQAPSGAGTH